MDPIKLICFTCVHNRPYEGGCAAFPEGIPSEVIETNKHDKPLKCQKNNLVFTPEQEG